MDRDGDDEWGGVWGDGRGGKGRSDRYGHEAWDEPPDGAADTRGLHRPRRLPRDPQRPARRARRPEVPPVSPAPPDGGCWPPWPEERPRLLYLLSTAAAIGPRIATSTARAFTLETQHFAFQHRPEVAGQISMPAL